MAYRKKAHLLQAYCPDIVIIPECEHPDKLKFPADCPQPTDVLWYGKNLHKGLGIFSYSDYRLKLMDVHNPDIKLVLPIAVTGGSVDLTLFAVWAYNPLDPSYVYIGQVWKAILYYESILKSGSVILAGDFNSNVLWDKLKRKVSHTMVVEKLKELDILSAYHTYFDIEQGAEVHPTYYMYRHEHRPYHIDYCFASRDMIDRIEKVEVGRHEEWSKYSDHNPMVVSFR